MVQLNRTHRWRPTRPSLSGRARVGAVSLFAGVVLLMLAGCGDSGPSASSPAGQNRVVGSRHGETLG